VPTGRAPSLFQMDRADWTYRRERDCSPGERRTPLSFLTPCAVPHTLTPIIMPRRFSNKARNSRDDVRSSCTDPPEGRHTRAACSFVAESQEGIDGCGAKCRAAGGEDRDDQQGCCGNGELHCAVSRNAVEHLLGKMDCSCRSRNADENASDGKGAGLAENRAQDSRAVCPERVSLSKSE